MDMDSDRIVWNDVEYKLKFVLDNPNFELPQVVRVVQGHMVDEDDSIASGQVLTIHGSNRVENIIGHDVYGKELKIPLNCPYKVKIISIGNPRRFKSVNELCFCENPPNYVLAEDTLTTGSNITLKENSVLELLDHVIDDDGSIIGINCCLDTNTTITLPINLSVSFLETISSEISGQRLLLSDIADLYTLPIQVEFLPVADKNCGYGPRLGVISLQKKSCTNSILSTAVIDGVRHAITFSADLPITIQMAIGVLGNESDNHIENWTERIDIKKFEHFSTPDPYSPMAIQDKIYDELKTPMLLRRRDNRHGTYRHTSSFSEAPSRKEKPIPNVSKKRTLSIDLGKDMKDLEKFVKSKFGFKSFRRRSSGKYGKDKKEKKRINTESDFDVHSTRKNGTSEDGDSSTGYSIDMRSNESESIYNDSYLRVVNSTDTMSFDSRSVQSVRSKNTRGSGDSGICLSGQNISRQRFRSRSRLTPDASSSHPSDDNFSEWSLPVKMENSPFSERKSTISQLSSSSYLWSANDSNDSNNNTNVEIKSNQEEAYKNEYRTDFLENMYSSTSSNSSSPEENRISPLTTAQIKSREEIRKLNEDGVIGILEILKLKEFKETFQENQINGELLLVLEQSDLVELNMSLFQAKKIVKYIKGWRPESTERQVSETSRRNSLNPRDWSENDVLIHMTTINLADLGRFCSANQVNGDLLLDILDKETLDSLKHDHNVKMSNLEGKKLLNFVVKGWRPDNSPKKSALA